MITSDTFLIFYFVFFKKNKKVKVGQKSWALTFSIYYYSNLINYPNYSNLIN